MPAAATSPGPTWPVTSTAEIGLHRLHGHGQAVEQAAGDEEGAEADEHAGRRQAGNRDGADDVRDEGAEIAAGAG